MTRPRFRILHSVVGTLFLVLVEFALLYAGNASVTEIGILIIAILGAALTIYVSTEAIEEVQGSRNLFFMLSAVLAQFIVFFAFQYWFLLAADPASFLSLANDPISLLLESTMAFVFNPLSMAADTAGRALLLIDTIGSLGLVLFVLQNISAFRRKSLDAHP